MTRAKKTQRRPVLLVTGMSGAGLSTALKALEDLGYHAVDNLPLALVPQLVAQKKGVSRPLAVGIDSRTWDFSDTNMLALAARLRHDKKIACSLVFVDCQDATLQQRFTETRRLHPLAVDRPVIDGVARDRRRMGPLRGAADIVIDTTDLKARDLRRIIDGHFTLDRDDGMQVFVTSFGFKHGIPRDADLVFDARFLDNPYWNKNLRHLSGRDKAVATHVKKDADYGAFFGRTTDLLGLLLPRYAQEGRNYLTIAVGCTGGRHRSVCIAEDMLRWSRGQGLNASLRHRDIDREDYAKLKNKTQAPQSLALSKAPAPVGRKAARGASRPETKKQMSQSLAPSKAPAPVGRIAARGASQLKRSKK